MKSQAKDDTSSSGPTRADGGSAASGRRTTHPLRAPSERIAGRYLVQSELGRGGTAVVYRVIDTTNARELALKQLTVASSDRYFNEQAAAFEREFHTLVQLSHPRIIEVYDFGADENGRYYTMELLEGSDLRERSPVPWREACSILHDVCSSLALIHSRGLVHRDISPRNIRATRDGSAKLIDFGALVPMGATGQIVGTPPFLPPEVLHRSSLDGRADLFSLGATLYYALTGRSAFPVREFSQLAEAWKLRPAPPSAIIAEIPAALDALVLSLIGLDPELRPRTAFEVMQRLAVIAGIERTETEIVTQAYVATPGLVGREATLALVRERIARAVGGIASGVLVRGAPGSGRSRMLDASAIEAKIAGAAVLRVNAARENEQPLAVAWSLAKQVVETLPALALASAQHEQVAELLFEAVPIETAGDDATVPRLKDLGVRGGERAALQTALARWLLRAAKEHPFAILVDDLQRVDEASLAWLAALLLGGTGRRLVVIATLATEAAERVADGLLVLERECVPIELAALSREQTSALLASVFGDVPNLQLASERIHSAALGNPRETMELVQALIAQGAARYARGRWSLPERLEASELPGTLREACERTLDKLSGPARLLAELHALAARNTLGRDDYARAASDVASSALDAAIAELLSQRVLVGDGHAYALARREWRPVLLARLDPAALEARHRMLAEVYAKDEAFGLERTHHLFAAGLEEAGLDLVAQGLSWLNVENGEVLTQLPMSVDRVALLLVHALALAERRQRPAREVDMIRRALLASSMVAEEAHYLRAAPAWLARLKAESGLADYEAITDAKDPGERLMRALTAVSQRYAATSESARVYAPEEAIKHLVYFVAISIAVGVRMQDCALLLSLPPLLEPLAPLSPLIHAMWQNTIATCETTVDNRPESARRRWLEVDAALAKVNIAEVNYVGPLRGAIAYGIGMIEARLGIRTAEERARALESDPLQKISATSLRRVVRLHQGDFEGAERFRRKAELLALQANQRQMFLSTLTAELIAYALAGDLTGIRQLAEALEPLAVRFPGWRGYKHLSDGYFEHGRGNYEAARVALERGLAVAEPDPNDPSRCFGSWPRLAGAYIETLVSLDRAAAAKAFGERALAVCAERGIDAPGFVIRRALALAEAKLGDYAGAGQRLEAVVEDLRRLEVVGLELGATFEARARIAIWSGDTAAIEHFGRLTATEYRHGERSALGARYERLMDEARRSGVTVLPQLTEFQTKVTTSRLRTRESLRTPNPDHFAGVYSASERAACALRLLCEAQGAEAGHLYLYQDGRLELAASRGARAADAELCEQAARYLAQQLRAADCATRVENSNSVPGSAVVTSWLDRAGRAHQFALLTSERGGSCAGVAVLELHGRSAIDTSARQLLAELTEELLKIGDASAVTDFGA